MLFRSKNSTPLSDLEIKTICSEGRGVAIGFNGKISLDSRIYIPTMQLFNVSINRFHINVSEDASRNILGMDILKYFDLKISITQSKVEAKLSPDWRKMVSIGDSVREINMQESPTKVETPKHF